MSARAHLGPRLPGLADAAGPLRARRVWPDRRRPGVLVVEATGDDGRVVAAVVHSDGTPEVLDPDPRLPALASWQASAGCRLIAHRAGKRAVLAVTDPGREDAPPEPTSRVRSGLPTHYVKLARPAAAARAARAHGEVAARLARRSGAPRVPDLHDHDDAAGVLVLGALPGRSLGDCVTAPAAGGARAAVATGWAVGRAIAALAGTDTTGSGLPGHGLDDERAVTAGWVQAALDHDVVRGPWRRRLRRAWEEAAGRLAELDPAPRVLTHRDLHDGQVLLTRTPEAAGRTLTGSTPDLGGDPGGDPGGVAAAILDLDTAALADPALDLANLLAHLDLLAAANPAGPAPAAVAGLRRGLLDALQACGHPALDADPCRVETLREVCRVRLAAVHAFRPAAASTVPLLLRPRA